MLERKGVDDVIAKLAGTPARNSRAGQRLRKERFREIVLHNPAISTEHAAAQAGIAITTGNVIRKQIVAEYGVKYAAPKLSKYSPERQAKRVLEALSINLESYANVGISGIDPLEVDIDDPDTVENIAAILDSLQVLTRFAKSLERRLQAPKKNTGSNVVQGNFATQETSE